MMRMDIEVQDEEIQKKMLDRHQVKKTIFLLTLI